MFSLGRHFVRTRELKEFEARLIRQAAEPGSAIAPELEALLRYASVLARLGELRGPDGADRLVAPQLEELRRWMTEVVVATSAPEAPLDPERLIAFAPALAVRLDRARRELLEAHASDLDAAWLDAEIRHKKLALVLGGGGGCGLSHLGLFAVLDELELVPDLIVGSSMGAMLGALRALWREYDALLTLPVLPRELEFSSVFRPFSGYSRFGFPGAFHMNLLRIARSAFQQLIGHSTPRFDELAIPFEVVATGVRVGFHLDEDGYADRAPPPGGFQAIRRTLTGLFRAIRQLAKEPRFLTPIVFGKEPGTESFPVVEAVGFSCALPGIFHYDVYHDDPETIGPLEEIFARHDLLRLCDGGVINNVPSQVAWDSVQRGRAGSRNALILASDVFAPLALTRNLLWRPIQQFARQNVTANRPYADLHKTILDPPSPLQLVANEAEIAQIVASGISEFADDRAYLKSALTPLPEYGVWRERIGG